MWTIILGVLLDFLFTVPEWRDDSRGLPSNQLTNKNRGVENGF
jgi:hypothetical protein